MVENQNEVPGQGPDDLAIARARDAATECVAAVKSFFDAATACQQSYSVYPLDWYKHNPIDYRPYAARLYRALRAGWGPIGKVWPELETIYYGYGWMGIYLQDEPFTRGSPPAGAWIIANAVLASALGKSVHASSLMTAWGDWTDEFIPDLSDFPFGDMAVWDDGLSALENFPWRWPDLIAAIDATPPSVSGDNAPQDEFSSSPKCAVSELQTLPRTESKLRLMRDRLDQFVSADEKAWKKERHTLEILSQAPDRSPSWQWGQLCKLHGFTSYILPDRDYCDLFFYSSLHEFAVVKASANTAWAKLRNRLPEVASKAAAELATAKGIQPPADTERIQRLETTEGIQRLADGVISAGDRIFDFWKRLRAQMTYKLQDPDLGDESRDDANRETQALPAPNQSGGAIPLTDEDPQVPDDEPGATETPDWCHAGPPGEDDGFFIDAFLTGQKQQLAEWTNWLDERHFENEARAGSFYVHRHHRTNFDLYFRSKQKYEEAAARAPWAHKDPPTEAEGFFLQAFLRGTKQQLAEWAGCDEPTFENGARSGRFYVHEAHETEYDLYFKNNRQYVKAAAKAPQEAKHSPPPPEQQTASPKSD